MELACLRGGRVFTFVQWKQFELGYLVFRAGQSKMQAIAIEKKQARWRQRPKGHSLEHLTYDFHFLNPRYCSNYLDEDFVRRSKAVAVKSDAKCVSKHVLFRYCIAATLRWTGMVPEWVKKVTSFPQDGPISTEWISPRSDFGTLGGRDHVHSLATTHTYYMYFIQAHVYVTACIYLFLRLAVLPRPGAPGHVKVYR